MRFVTFLTREFLPRVFLEFIWLLFSVSFGMYVVSVYARIELDPIIRAYGQTLVMVLFNAAALRYVMAYGLEWIDRELDKANAQKANDVAMIRAGFTNALQFFRRRKEDKPADEK